MKLPYDYHELNILFWALQLSIVDHRVHHNFQQRLLHCLRHFQRWLLKTNFLVRNFNRIEVQTECSIYVRGVENASFN